MRHASRASAETEQGHAPSPFPRCSRRCVSFELARTTDQVQGISSPETEILGFPLLSSPELTRLLGDGAEQFTDRLYSTHKQASRMPPVTYCLDQGFWNWKRI